MRRTARSAFRSLFLAVLVLISSVAVGLTTTFTAVVGLLAATTPLIVPGTGTPNPADKANYMENAVAYYVAPSGACGEGCDPPVPVPYIAQFWPFPFEGWGGLQGARWNVSVASGVTSLTSELVGANNPTDDHPVAVLGYSQGATVASLVKTSLADLPITQKDALTFVLIGNPNRPDGGLFMRLAALGTVPILDATFGQPTPTDVGIATYDIALVYDGVADAPAWVLNPLALLNAVAGFQYTHGTYLSPDGDDPATATPYGYTPDQVQAAIENATESCTGATHCQQTGDTYYITLPAKTLPIMQPFLDLGEATGTSALVVPIVDLVQPITQTLIETAYNRGDYGEPTPFQLLPRFNPVQVASDLVNDIPEGINAALQPGLQPLPGWTDPLETVTEDTTVSTVSTVDAAKTDDTTLVKAADKPDRKPLVRFSPIAKPNEGLSTPTDDSAEPERPSLRKALGIKGHPVRDFADSVRTTVRKTLGVDDTKAKDKDTGKDNEPAAKEASEPAA